MRLHLFRRIDRQTATEPTRRQRRALLVEHLSDRCLLAAITGLVFEDGNQSLRRDQGESSLTDRLVYIDTNINGVIDTGEPWQLSKNSGGFLFPDLVNGDYEVRLYDGSVSQRQTTPRTVGPLSSPSLIQQLDLISVRGTQAFGVSGSQAVRIDSLNNSVVKVDLPTNPSDAMVLPDGRLLVIFNSVAPGVPETGSAIVDFSDSNVDTIDLGLGPQESGWSKIGIGSNGQGFLVSSNVAGAVRSVSFSSTVNATPTPSSVSGVVNLQVGQSNTKTVFWRQLADRVALQVYDNATTLPIGSGETSLEGVKEILDYDDASGMVLARRSNDHLVLLDADRGFTIARDLQILGNVPAVLDGLRDLVVAVDSAKSELVIYDWLEDLVPVRIPSFVQQVTKLELLDNGNVALLVSPDRVHTVRLNVPAPGRAKLTDDAPSADLVFGAEITGDNHLPQVKVNVDLELNEDSSIAFNSLGTVANVSDEDLDELVYLLTDSADHGEVLLTTSGTFKYTPAKDYFGTDRVSFIVHDGRGSSNEVHLNFDVKPVLDPVGGAQISLTPTASPMGELTIPGSILGEIFVLSPDAFETFIFHFNDPRFTNQGNLLIVAPGAQFNFEQQPFINLVIQVEQPGNPELMEGAIQIQVGDQPEPPTEVNVTGGSVDENLAGESVAFLSVVDEDATSSYSFTVVNDERFIFNGSSLQLVDGVALDFELEPLVLVAIQVRDGSLPQLLERTVTVTVNPINEAPVNIRLSSASLVEKHTGVTLGTLSASDPDAGQSVSFVVDDSRFEIIDGNVLKLREDQFVSFDLEQRVLLRVTATDNGNPNRAASEVIEVNVQAVGNPFHNPSMPFDVDNNQLVEPVDALIIINHLNQDGPSQLSGPFEEDDSFYDVNNDGAVTPLDVLLLINELNHDALGESSDPLGPGDDSDTDSEDETDENGSGPSGEPQGILAVPQPQPLPVGPVLPPPRIFRSFASGEPGDKQHEGDEACDANGHEKGSLLV